MRTMRLYDRFESSDSFMHFATGLRALREYHSTFDDEVLEESAESFRTGVEKYPGEPILHYYFALVMLEQITAADRKASPAAGEGELPVDAAYANRALTSAREGSIMDALLHFEQYEQHRSGHARNAERYLALWSEYNRAAAHAHRLNAQGYLRARGILRKHLADDGYGELRRLPSLPDVGVNGDGARFESILQPEFLRYTTVVEYILQFTRNPRSWKLPQLRAIELPLNVAHLVQGARAPEWRALILQMESLFLLTRARPLREPDALRATAHGAKDNLGLEGVDVVARALTDFHSRVSEAHSEGLISEKVYRDVTSDHWSQKGHLECARALAEQGVTPLRILEQWSDLSRRLDNRVAFEILMKNASDATRLHLEQAAVSFRTALAYQPQWQPALGSLRDVERLLQAKRSATS